MNTLKNSVGALLGLTIALASMGCSSELPDVMPITEEHQVDEPKVRRTVKFRHVVGATSEERFTPLSTLLAAREGAGPAASERIFDYALPAGWQELPRTQFRLVNLQHVESPEAECTVSIAGGGTLPNVNRWLDQLGLAPLDSTALAGLPKLELLGGQAIRLDVTGDYEGMMGAKIENARLLGAVLELDPSSGLFVKMVGPADVIEANVAGFEELCATLRPAGMMAPPSAGDTSAHPEPGGDAERETATTQPATTQPAAATFDPSALHWTAPSTWKPVQKSSMRLVTLSPEDAPEVEFLITPLPGDAGGVLSNLDRWADQLGQPKLGLEGLAKLPKVEVLGNHASLLEVSGDYTDMAGNHFEGYALLGLVVPVADHSLFIKMTGPTDLVARERANFEAVLASLHYDG